MLTGVSAFSSAPAIARSRASDRRIGWPLAAKSAHKFQAGGNFGKPGELALQLLAADFPEIGQASFAEMCEISLRKACFASL